ncbi:amino acid permease [Hyphomicrobium sp.]|uniref:APC family permease n=1 Tax=Hyphomicrobium sp. TaxID=82 RepID=UPI000F9B8E07|nr:amino acid permease [Hyphomicrobium sp.]MBN9246823.1 amino acid permease [Hyphomicrobium sp.]RUP10296.1 MAG: amino acid permease [Hyphomicrobium sp.]
MTTAASMPAPSSIAPRIDVRTVSTVTATALAVADMIGIGVFTSLGFQVASIPSVFPVLLLWIVGGIAALCGALAYAELAAAFPRSGGEYNFLSRIYHPAIGFLAGWISATLGFSAPIALAAMAFGVYFKAIIPDISPLFLGLAVVWIVTAVHLSGIKHSSKFQNISTIVKGTLILALIIAGLAYGTPQPISFAPSAADMDYIASAPFAVSLVFVMYAYSGWNAATYIAGEIREPSVSLPRSIVAATLIVITSYVALNAVFLYTTPISAMAGQLDVALVAGKHIFGEFGGRIVGGLICIGLISSISAMTWIGPRVTMAMGKDHAMLRALSRTTSDGVPRTAILLQLGIVSVLLMTQSFEAILDTIQFSLTLCSFLAVLGVIVLRWTSPDLPRPYRTWGYPITPLIFLGVTAFMMYYLVVERPLQSLAGLAIMLTGLAVYAFAQQRSMSDVRP